MINGNSVSVKFQNTERSTTTMELKFLGTGSGFADEHTSAYFAEEKDLVIIDCPISTFQKMKKHNLNDYENIYVLVTHTHGDHIGGLGLFAQYTFFALKKKITIIAPSEQVAEDIHTVFSIEGNEKSWYELITADNLKGKNWFFKSILTEHSPQLAGKCFGYQLIINGKNIVYTGDTSTIEPFESCIMPGTELYVDTSVYYGMIHLKLEDAIKDFLTFNEMGTKVYLMHLDDSDAAEKIVEKYTDINVVKAVD